MLWVLASMAVVLFFGTLFVREGSIDAVYSLAALSLLLWALWFLAVAYCFQRSPPEVQPGDRFWVRTKTRFQRAGMWMLAMTVAGLLMLTLVLTSRTLGLVAGQ